MELSLFRHMTPKVREAPGHRAAEHPLKVLDHLRIRVRRRDVLADGVERASVTPRVEHVPLVGALVRGVDARRDVTRAHESLGIREARNRLVGGEVAAGRNLRVAGIAAEVHVHLAGPRLEPDEADEIAAIATYALAVAVAS